MTRSRLIASGLALVSALLLAACASLLAPSPQHSSYFVLAPLPPSAAPAAALDPGLAMGVFNADFPDYLNRPQLVTRVGNDQIMIHEYLRWAEPLGGGLASALAQDISLLSGSNRVAVFPLPQSFGQEFEVFLQVFRFDGSLGGDVTLRVLWRVTGPNGKPTYFAKTSTFTRQAPAGADPVAGYFETLNLLVGDLGREIVETLPAVRANKAALAAQK